MNSEYPYVVLYEEKWTTEDLYEIFTCEFLEDIDMEPLTEEQTEKLFGKFWKDKHEQLIDANPPSEWGSPYHDIIGDWVSANEDFIKSFAQN